MQRGGSYEGKEWHTPARKRLASTLGRFLATVPECATACAGVGAGEELAGVEPIIPASGALTNESTRANPETW